METITGYWIVPSQELFDTKGAEDAKELLSKLAVDDDRLREAWPAVAKYL